MDTRHTPFEINGIEVPVGERREIYIKISETFMASSVQIPVTVVHGLKPGPKVFVTAAVHGDEINGVDIVRRLIYEIKPEELHGTLVAVPVVNIPGFLTQSRYVQYHRDLNRFFPGKKTGNNAEKICYKIFKEVVSRCDFGIDLHTAAHGRANLPHIRGDVKKADVRALARSFGATVLVDQVGVRGSLRYEATRAGVPTIIFEAGESSRFSRAVSRAGLRGVLNVLIEKGMLPERKKDHESAPFQVIVKTSDWVRAEKGGILDLSVKPGDLVYVGDEIGTVFSPFGKAVTHLRSPLTGIVIGVTTAPLCIPGTGLLHIAKLKKTLATVERKINKRSLFNRAKRKASKKAKKV